MFTGIIEAVGKITQIESHASDCSIYFDCGDLAKQVIQSGDSIAVNGCCLTVVEKIGSIVKVDVSNETLNRTLIKEYQQGTLLNLELAMLPDMRFGGHIVSGHVDGLATVVGMEKDDRSTRFDFKIINLGRYIAEKGSVTLDGVSLTVNSVDDITDGTVFSVNIIPYTLEETIFSEYALNSKVHIEVDMIARYIERLTQFGNTNDN